MIRVGASQVDITPEIPVILAGSAELRKANRIHSRLYASATAIDDGKKRLIVISLDLLFLNDEICKDLRERIAEVAETSPSLVNICCTHTHNGPGMFDSLPQIPVDLGLVYAIKNKIISAAVEAVNTQKEAERYYTQDSAPCSFNRRTVLDNGKLWGSPGPQDPPVAGTEGPEDQSLHTVCFKALDKELITVWVSCSAHPTNWLYENIISADYPGEIRSFLQDELGSELPVLFLQGACGNTSTIDFAECQYLHDFSAVEHGKNIGKMIGSKVLDAVLKKNPPLPDPLIISSAECKFKVPVRHCGVEDMSFEEASNFIKRNSLDDLLCRYVSNNHGGTCTFDPVLWEYYWADSVVKLESENADGAYYLMNISAFGLGNILFVSCPGELFAEFQFELKNKFPDFNIIVTELMNGYCGYMVTDLALSNGGYETRLALSSFLAPESGSIWVENAVDLLHKIE